MKALNLLELSMACIDLQSADHTQKLHVYPQKYLSWDAGEQCCLLLAFKSAICVGEKKQPYGSYIKTLGPGHHH